MSKRGGDGEYGINESVLEEGRRTKITLRTRRVKAELLCPDITIEQYPLPPIYLPIPRRLLAAATTRKLSVLLRIKISSKSYGRLQTNRAVAFPTGCRNFRRLSTFPTALAATFPILLPPTSFYAYPRPTRRRSAK